MISGGTGRAGAWGAIAVEVLFSATPTHPAIARATSRCVTNTADMSQS